VVLLVALVVQPRNQMHIRTAPLGESEVSPFGESISIFYVPKSGKSQLTCQTC
jgi:hypothetical protein